MPGMVRPLLRIGMQLNAFHVSDENNPAARRAIAYEDDFFQPVPPKKTASEEQKHEFLKTLRDFQVISIASLLEFSMQ